MLASPLAVLDVEDVEGFAAGVLHKHLRARGSYLNEQQQERCLSFLIAAVWEESQRWDPGKAKGKPFSHHVVTIAHRRVIDWFRSDPEFGSTRWGPRPQLVPLDPYDSTSYSEPGVGDTIDVEALSPAGRAALLFVAVPLYEGGIKRLQEESGLTQAEVDAELDKLTAELEQQGVVPSVSVSRRQPSVKSSRKPGHCRRGGHLLDEENTDITTNGHRRCRACHRARYAHEFEAQAV